MSAKTPSPRLGRGLAALLGEKPGGAGAPSQLRTLAVDRLEPSPFQPRMEMDDGALAELAASIARQGVLQPILARPKPRTRDRFEIIAGERRWRAAQMAGLHEVPVQVLELSDADAMAAALVENLQRQDLNAIEEAEGLKRLVSDFGLSQEQIGEAVGKSRSHVANSLRLLNLPAPVQVELRRGTLSAGHARALLSMPDPTLAALSVIARGLNVRQTEALARQAANPATVRKSAEKDPDIRALERELTAKLGLKIEIVGRGQRGSVTIHYKSLDQLDGLIALLNQS